MSDPRLDSREKGKDEKERGVTTGGFREKATELREKIEHVRKGVSDEGDRGGAKIINLSEVVMRLGIFVWEIVRRAYQAAEIIAAVNGVSQSYIVPEYSFLDAHGLGAYEGKNLGAVSEVYASDSISTRMKPHPIDNGTPNESVADVFIRVTQLMSILETQYSESIVIIVSPDMKGSKVRNGELQRAVFMYERVRGLGRLPLLSCYNELLDHPVSKKDVQLALRVCLVAHECKLRLKRWWLGL
ncbi:unnamed protein product [Rhodiola kirilowii]